MTKKNHELVGQSLTLKIEGVAHGGACVARADDGRVVFVRHTLPEETVRATVTRTRSKLAWADATDIIAASPDRIPSVWPQAGPGGVGGGELGHVHPEAALRWKTDVIRDQIRRIGGEKAAQALQDAGGITVEATPMDKGQLDLTGRRTRIEMVAATDRDGVKAPLGMYEPHGKNVIPLDSMPLADPRLQDLDVWAGVRGAWTGKWAPGDRLRLLAPTADEVTVVTSSGIFDASGTAWTQTRRLKWCAEVGELGTLEYQVRPEGFWQTHTQGASVLANALAEVTRDLGISRVIELYSGAGLFSAVLGHLVGDSGRVLTIEGDEAAVADADINVRALGNVETWVGNVDGEAVAQLATEMRSQSRGRRPQLIVLDPPRQGAGIEVCEAVSNAGADFVVLISCDPAAGARDFAALIANGYTPVSMRAWDLFPYTHHVESMTLFCR